jgi:excisionase family DNA binding protein
MRYAMSTNEKQADNTGKRRAFGIDEFCRRYGVGRTTAYAEMAAGRLRRRKVGKRSLVAEDDAEAWLASLPTITPPSTE